MEWTSLPWTKIRKPEVLVPEFFQPFHLIVLLILLPIPIIPFWHIFKKAGFAPLLSLLIVFPLINLVVLYYVAFSPWKALPIEQKHMPIEPMR
jgi:hypothetical protein